MTNQVVRLLVICRQFTNCPLPIAKSNVVDYYNNINQLSIMSTLHHESIFETILDEVCEEFGIEYDPMGDPDVNHVIDEMVMERFLSMGG